MPHYLLIEVDDSKTNLKYVVDENVLATHSHDFGLKHLESHAMSKIASSKFLDGVFYILEYISLYERIPTEFVLCSPRYSSWIKNLIEEASYTQFYTNKIPVCVKIDGNREASSNYARHKKTTFSFKV